MTHENLVHNAYLDNLHNDWLAVNAAGHPIARASTEAAVRRAAPDAAHYLNAAMLADRVKQIDGLDSTEAAPKPDDNPVAAGLDAVKAQGALAPDADAKADKDLDTKVAAAKTAKKPGSAKK